MGAEALLGQGDMLYLPPGTGYPQRVHGAFVADQEVHRVVEYLKAQGEPQYIEGVLNSLDESADEGGAAGESLGAEADPLYDQAVEIVLKNAPRLDLAGAAAPAHRLQPRRAPDRAHGAAGLVSAMQTNGNREVLAPMRQD